MKKTANLKRMKSKFYKLNGLNIIYSKNGLNFN